MDKPFSDLPPGPNERRLDSWKKIAVYLKRDITTVQRWEKREGMPIHRHLHDRMGSVYAYRADLDAWMRTRNLQAAQNGNGSLPTPSVEPPIPTSPKRWPLILTLSAIAVALAIGALLW